MTGFFEQLCKVVAETERQRPGISPSSEEIKQFFSEQPRKVETIPPEVKSSVNTAAVPVRPEVRSVPTPPPPMRPEVKSVPTPPPPVSGNFATLEEIYSAVAACSRCPLGATRTNPVPGEGNPNARLMFIGEAPGFDEDRLGRPFVGKAGALLDKMISAMQFTREEVYIANIVKCRPPDNRIPAPEEAQCCIGYLKRQIELIRPEVIVLLGATAVKYLLNVTTGISRMRGRWLSYENIPVMATFHPAFLLRQESAKRETWNDLQQVMARFGKYHNPGAKRG